MGVRSSGSAFLAPSLSLFTGDGMRKDLVERAVADIEREALDPDPLEADPCLSVGKPLGISGVRSVRFCEASGEHRARPWQVRCAPNYGYVCRVASVVEGAAVADAWRKIGTVLNDSADLRAMRATAARMAADFVSGQCALPLGDGLEGLPSDVAIDADFPEKR